MLKGYLVLVLVAVLLAAVLPVLVLAATYFYALPLATAQGSPTVSPEQASGEILRLLAGAAVAFVACHQLLARGRAFLEAASAAQADELDTVAGRLVVPAILASAAVSLFLELAVIRWLGELVPVFAFYKNFALLACFAGLGLGYSLARERQIPLVLSLPLLLAQALSLTVVRYGLREWQYASLWLTPFREQLNMGVFVASSTEHFVAIYSLLTTVFLLTALAFVPVGQLCGRLLTREPDTLRAYGVNLLGSLAGVALMMAASGLWTPPPVWFAVACVPLIAFQLRDARVVFTSAVAGFAIVMVLAWPVSPGLERIHTPYQLVERGVGPRGLTSIKAAGHYYQRVHDLAASNQNIRGDRDLAAKAAYYDLVYKVRQRPPQRVAVVGAGMGNDVAAALRAGAQEVDAVEIDPAIQALGRDYHPEHPYSDPRTHVIVDDARSFLRRTERSYDVIVFGLLDSHTLLSHASSVRLDSFVYTVEAFREARRRLAPGGVLSLSFSVLSGEMAAKLYAMLREAFDGHGPLSVYSGYDGAIIFVQSREGDLQRELPRLEALGLRDQTPTLLSKIAAQDLATDDWPFLYMPHRVYPRSYAGMVALLLALSYLLVRTLQPAGVGRGGWAFFFLGAGFMLVETKAITELGLWFGNTWQVVGITIGGVLVMGFLANAAVRGLGSRHWLGWALLLVASLAGGYYVSLGGGLPFSAAGRLGTVVIVTLPVLFGGALFSTLLARFQDISAALAMNLLGAMAGGLLEYNAMYFGYRSLYLLAAGLYLLAAASVALRR